MEGYECLAEEPQSCITVLEGEGKGEEEGRERGREKEEERGGEGSCM